MKNELKIIIVVFVGFVAMLWIAKPLRELLVNYSISELDARLMAGIFTRLLIVSIAIWIIRKLDLKLYNGLNKGQNTKNLYAIGIPSVFIIFGIISNWNIYIKTENYVLLLFIFSVIIIGIAEEFIFRGIIQPLFIKYFKSQQKVLYLSVIITALIFGLIHYVNILKEPDNFSGITHQVFFAISIGVFFGGLMLRTNSIIVPSMFHGLVNFSFGAGDLKHQTVQVVTKEITEGVNWNSIIPTTLFFIFIFISGIYMINKVNSEVILRKLKIKTSTNK